MPVVATALTSAACDRRVLLGSGAGCRPRHGRQMPPNRAHCPRGYWPASLELVRHVDPPGDPVGVVHVGIGRFPRPDPDHELGTLVAVENLIEHAVDQ